MPGNAQRFKELESGYHPNKQNPPSDAAGVCAAMKANMGFLKPWKKTAPETDEGSPVF